MRLASFLRHGIFPVFEDKELLGTIALWSLAQIPTDTWSTTKVRDTTERRAQTVHPDCDVMEALRLLTREHQQPMLLVISEEGRMAGIVTKSDILQALTIRRDHAGMKPSRRYAQTTRNSLDI